MKWKVCLDTQANKRIFSNAIAGAKFTMRAHGAGAERGHGEKALRHMNITRPFIRLKALSPASENEE
jgi:hypothetical protein